jgi:predicted enzyme related to lactoylglutathione lyase
MQVIFAVTDLARSLDFYERAFGWPRNEWIDYANYVELLPPTGGSLGLYERDGYAQLVGAQPAEIPDERISPAYLYIRVDDVEEAVRQIEAAGGRALGELAPRSWGETAAWFADPDGNVVAVAQPAPVTASS